MHLFILTGAGISAESGISTFRGQNGLWEGHSIEEVASPEGFQKHPELVQRFYNLRRAQLKEVNPNPAHRSITRLQEIDGVEVTLVTQNVDDLHERAGSRNILHVHGELYKARCSDCEKIMPHREDLNETTRCPDCHGQLRPHICWFGESPFHRAKIYTALMNADIFLSIGTSGIVFPAASYVQIARQGDIPTIEFNIEATEATPLHEQAILGKASKTLPRWVDDFLAVMS